VHYDVFNTNPSFLYYIADGLKLNEYVDCTFFVDSSV